MIASFSTTIAVLNRALSETPRTRTTVISATIRNAGRLKMIGMPKTCGASCSADAARSTPSLTPASRLSATAVATVSAAW